MGSNPTPSATTSVLATTIALAATLILATACAPDPPPTWSASVAALVHENCTPCHNPDGPAPFPLATYDDARAHAARIAEVVASGSMPPWPPRGEARFANDRSLSEDAKRAIVRWAEAGAPAGDLSAAPPPPSFGAGWRLGAPDLVVEAPEAFELPAGDRDVFRNLVIPVPVDSTRLVRAVELRPGDARHVHHAILYVDRTGTAARLDADDPGPGFAGMDPGGAESPDGHFLGWTPGSVPFGGDRGSAWALEPGTDLVLQLHLLPSDRPREIRPRIGLHFTDRRQRNLPVVVTLRRFDLDIPPGAEDYRVRDTFRVPVASEILSVFPHAHYLGKRLAAEAVLPDGGTREIIEIPDWDFMRQGQYFYAEPLALPAGSEIVMDYTYDNTAENPANPSNPPVRVRGGDRSTDEMAELILEIRPRDPADRRALIEARARHDLAVNPGDWRAQFNLALSAREAGRVDEAIARYRAALEAGGDEVPPVHYNLGNALLATGDRAAAARHFERAVALDPDLAQAWFNLGYVREAAGDSAGAARGYARALEADPRFVRAHLALGNLRLATGDVAAAVARYERALEADPGSVDARTSLGNALLRQGRVEAAVGSYREALALAPIDPVAGYNLAVALRRAGRGEEAVTRLESVVRATPGFFEAHLLLGELHAAAGRVAAAESAYRRALALRPDSEEARRGLSALGGS